MALPKTPKTREELALGVINPRSGKREKGFLNMLKVMKQNREKLAAGEIGDEDLIERAFIMADKEIARREAAPGEDPTTLDEVDESYRSEQERDYRDQYGWGDDANANDEAALQMLLDIEIEQRRTQRQLRRAKIDWKERTELLGELRQLATTHASLQKSLGIDRTTRDLQKRNIDPMDVLKAQIESGAQMMAQLIEDAPAAFALVPNEAALRVQMKHQLGFPYPIVDSILSEHRRVLKLDSRVDQD